MVVEEVLEDRPRHESAAYGASIESGPPVIDKFENRGKPWRNANGEFETVHGVAYHEPEDIEDHPNSTFVGFGYQISNLFNIDAVAETFGCVLDLSMMYKIDDEDYGKYKEYWEAGALKFQDIVDDQSVIVKPPVIEIRNAVEAPNWVNERVSFIGQMFDHRWRPKASDYQDGTIPEEDKNKKGRWSWYVALYAQVRVICYEEFEFQRFPFSQNHLQIHFQSKLALDRLMFVPYCARSCMPHYSLFGGKVVDALSRGNLYKCDSSVGNWVVQNHHLAIVPKSILTPMGSGAKFSTAIVVIELQQTATFYLWNIVPLVFFLPILSATAALEDLGAIADRMSIVLLLLLTLATYKITMESWVPQKDYLTKMDIYVLLGFGMILLIGCVVGTTSGIDNFQYTLMRDELRRQANASLTDSSMLDFFSFTIDDSNDAGGNESSPEAPTLSERLDALDNTICMILVAVWVIFHIGIFLSQSYWFNGWDVISTSETKKLKEVADFVIEEKEAMDCDFHEHAKPPKPLNQEVPDEVPLMSATSMTGLAIAALKARS